MSDETPALLDLPAIARSLGRPEQTLRQWASTGVIKRYGKDERGRTLLDIDEVVGVARSRPARRRRNEEGRST